MNTHFTPDEVLCVIADSESRAVFVDSTMTTLADALLDGAPGVDVRIAVGGGGVPVPGDGDGYLYLTDRSTFMVVSGGVNPYPQEAENVLIMHPAIIDAAVFGVPNDEYGEEVKAVSQPVDGIVGGPELETELLEYCRFHLAAYKCPRTIEFDPDLPRDPNGKLYERRIRHRYWQRRTSRIL